MTGYLSIDRVKEVGLVAVMSLSRRLFLSRLNDCSSAKLLLVYPRAGRAEQRLAFALTVRLSSLSRPAPRSIGSPKAP
jgi:hypothetical protein